MIILKIEHRCFVQPLKHIMFDSVLEEKKNPIRGSQSSIILEFMKVGVKIECQRQKTKSKLKLIKLLKAISILVMR
jgi:hypothetical protein